MKEPFDDRRSSSGHRPRGGVAVVRGAHSASHGHPARPDFDRLQAARSPDRVLREASSPRSAQIKSRSACSAANTCNAFAKPATSTTSPARRRWRASSLRLQPQGNVQALGVIASSDIALHHFARGARRRTCGGRAEPFNENARAQTASILMELGRYREPARSCCAPDRTRSQIRRGCRSARATTNLPATWPERRVRDVASDADRRPHPQHPRLHALVVSRA